MSAAGSTHHPSLITHHPVLRRGLVVAGLCLSLAGCGMVNWSVSNSSDGCPNPRGTVPCP